MSDLHLEQIDGLIKEIKRHNPHGSEKEHHDEFCSKSAAIVASMTEYCFANRYPRFSIVHPAPGISVLKETIIERQRRNEEARRKGREYIRHVFLMDMIGSNGKPNRHYTREEQFAEADWRNAIGNALRPGQVTGKHLTEQDLQNLKMRNSRRRA